MAEKDPSSRFWLPSTEELEEFLTKRLRGQPEAIGAVAKQYGFFRSGLKKLEESDRHRPIGVFVLAGPSRVGKTELGRVLAECFYGTRMALTKLDMNNFKERHTVSRLIGSPPGYIGHGDPCEFSTQRLHARIPGFKDQIIHKDQQKSALESIPPSILLSPLVPLQYQLLVSTLKKRGYELLLLELTLIKEALADIENEIQTVKIEEKSKGSSVGKEKDKAHLGLLQRMLRAHHTELLSLYVGDVQNNIQEQSREVEQNTPHQPPKEVSIKTTPDQAQPREVPTETDEIKPILIIILDEIEKAHSEVFDFLLNIFDDGRITLGDGSETCFDNAFFFLTTNAGAEVMSAALQKKSKTLGFCPPDQTRNFDEIVKKKLETIFKPEFLNRIDKIITFKDLSEQDLRDILDLHLEEFTLGLQRKNYFLIIEPAARDWIIKKALTRPEAQSKAVLDELRTQVKLPLAKQINDNKIKPGSSIVVSLNAKKQIIFSLRKKPTV